MTDMTAFEREVAAEVVRDMGPSEPVDDLAILEAITASSRSRRWGFAPFAALKFGLAAAIVALFGGLLLAGILNTQPSDELVPAAVTDSPSPMTTEDLLSDMVTEEVEPGVFRVEDDGERDLRSADLSTVVAGQDGNIWLEGSGHLVRLGGTQTHDWRLGERDWMMGFEVAKDGSIWAVAVKDDESLELDESVDRDQSILRSFDGETWTTHAAADIEGVIGDVEITPDGVVWAVLGRASFGYIDADGSTWQTIERPPSFEAGAYGIIATDSGLWAPDDSGVWHYADGTWKPILYLREVPGGGVMPDEVFWGLGTGDFGGDGTAASGDTLFRHDETGWQRWALQEHQMGASWGAEPYAVAPDGSFWAGWSVDHGGNDFGCRGVSRFDGSTWTRYLADKCINGFDTAPDGSVWLLARDGDDPELPARLYVVTPEAVAASE